MLTKVCIESDALQLCMGHALSTEKEEIMGLLVGEVDGGVSHVYAAIMLYRVDKRKDRVEISPEQLSEASAKAEELGLKTKGKRPMRIIGWYHSHPHITVWPSHVDVRTQASYQLMDEDFIGVIVSCFNDDSNNLGQMQVTCFQSTLVGQSEPARYERLEIPLDVIPCDYMSEACLDTLATFPEILLKEESDAYGSSLSSSDQDMITAIQNASEFSQAIMKIIEFVCSPFLQNMDLLIKSNKNSINMHRKQIDILSKKKNIEGK